METQQGSVNWIQSLVVGFTDTEANNLGNSTEDRAWGTPYIGFARGNDAIFYDYKRHVGARHWAPAEIFNMSFDARSDGSDLTVISWILPQTSLCKQENGRMTKYPAKRWARSRIFGESFNNELRRYAAQTLEDAGFPTVAPMLAEEFSTYPSESYQISSTWSERHIAYACGLGTFGICDGLITPVGKAVRLGSIVAKISVEPTKREYTDHRAYCLFDADGTCGRCIKRCPAGALSADGHDKDKCLQYMSEVTRPYVTNTYGFAGYGCGLCQTNVPCESGIPNLVR